MALFKDLTANILTDVIYLIVRLTKYYSGHQIKITQLGKTCSMYGGEERCIQGFGGEIWGKETTWKNQPQMKG